MHSRGFVAPIGRLDSRKNLQRGRSNRQAKAREKVHQLQRNGSLDDDYPMADSRKKAGKELGSMYGYLEVIATDR